MKYRNQSQILADLLSITSNSGQQGIKVTSLMSQSNISYTVFSKILKNITGAGLVNKIEYDGKNTYVITDKGRLYLEEYKRFSDMVGSFGLEL